MEKMVCPACTTCPVSASPGGDDTGDTCLEIRVAELLFRRAESGDGGIDGGLLRAQLLLPPDR